MNKLDQLYQQVILDHAKRRVGSPLVENTEGLLARRIAPAQPHLRRPDPRAR